MLVTELFNNLYRQNAEIYDADNFVSFFYMGVERIFLFSEKDGRCHFVNTKMLSELQESK
jgi:hypothetical protein